MECTVVDRVRIRHRMSLPAHERLRRVVGWSNWGIESMVLCSGRGYGNFDVCKNKLINIKKKVENLPWSLVENCRKYFFALEILVLNVKHSRVSLLTTKTSVKNHLSSTCFTVREVFQRGSPQSSNSIMPLCFELCNKSRIITLFYIKLLCYGESCVLN